MSIPLGIFHRLGYVLDVPTSPVPVGELFADKYRVERVIGEGGMGIVVAAYHEELEQHVAIKFLLEDAAQSDEGAERFRREARAAAKIHSDHVVRVYDVGVLDDGTRYMVMEYLEGQDLSEELGSGRSVSAGAACGFILEALDAVAQAHSVGIVHRDLKPANLFLAQRPDGTTRVKVLDFGISKSVGKATTEQMSLTKTSAWIGSPLYMAPEQMQSARDVDFRADIWSLGAILYELLSGHPPYQAESLPQLCNLLITEDPPKLGDVVPGLSDRLAETVMACLVRDREKRIQSASELAQRLSEFATTITGSSMPGSLIQRVQIAGPMSTGSATVLSSPIPLVPSGTETGGTPQVTVQSGTGSQSNAPSERAGAETSSSWGGTDRSPGEGGAAKKVALVAALVLAFAGGTYVLTGSDADSSTVSSAATPEEESPSAVEPAVEPEEALTPEVEEAAGDSEANPELSAQNFGAEKIEEEPLEPEAKPAPVVVKPVARPATPKPRPAARPTPPAPAPAPAETDDFADFGGRR